MLTTADGRLTRPGGWISGADGGTVPRMSDDSRYHVRRGERQRLVDVVQPEPAPAPPAPRPPRRVPQGSTPALKPPEPNEFELELASPTQELTTLSVGGHTVMIERLDERVVVSLPGAVRLLGSADEAERLALALREAAARILR